MTITITLVEPMGVRKFLVHGDYEASEIMCIAEQLLAEAKGMA